MLDRSGKQGSWGGQLGRGTRKRRLGVLVLQLSASCQLCVLTCGEARRWHPGRWAYAYDLELGDTCNTWNVGEEVFHCRATSVMRGPSHLLTPAPLRVLTPTGQEDG